MNLIITQLNINSHRNIVQHIDSLQMNLSLMTPEIRNHFTMFYCCVCITLDIFHVGDVSLVYVERDDVGQES